MDANQSIAEHNNLFNQSRSTYEDVKNELESGGDPSRQADRIAETRDTLEEARSNLQDAQDSLSGVEDLEVDPVVKEYARLLSEAMDAQIEAEDTEIEFYNTLEEDPALQNTRDEALDLLSQADESYQQAQDRYAQAREVATRNPELISLPVGGSTSPQETTQQTTS